MFLRSLFSIPWRILKNPEESYIHELYNDLAFLPEGIIIEKVEKIVINCHDRTDYAIHMGSLKEAINHGLILKKVNRVIKFNQNAWLKPCIDVNTMLRQKAKSNFEKDLFKLMNDTVFGRLWKMWENIEILNL